MSPTSSGRLSLLFELFATAQRTRLLLAEAMEESEISPTEYAVYSLLDDLDEASPTEMAGRLGLPVTTMLDHLRVMEANRHISKLPNPADGRSYLVTLSAEGRAVHRRAGADFEQGMSRIVENLNIDESEVRDMLRELAMATDAALADLRRSERASK